MTARSFRILCVGETWFGSDARAAFAALRRLGHSVQVVDEAHFVPLHWRSFAARGVRRLLRALFVRELSRQLLRSISSFQPQCLFVFKGSWLHPQVLRECSEHRVRTLNFYPDVSFLSHGPCIPAALPLYDHVFTSKTYGLLDMARHLGVTRSSHLPPGFDPELHRPLVLDAGDRRRYGADVAFVGTWSAKKEAVLAGLARANPGIHLRIWGEQWHNSRRPELSGAIAGHGVTGDEYVKAICGASVCLGLLSERGAGASSGDLVTARTFQIPACGAFMLHERNAEAGAYFAESSEAAYFGSSAELAEQVRRYLGDPVERSRIAQGGLRRSASYSADERMKVVIQWLERSLEDVQQGDWR